MDHSATFARHFARLVWLLVDDPANTDEQKGALRALATVARTGAVAIRRAGDALVAGGEQVPALLAGVSIVAARLGALGATRIDVDRGATAGDIFRLARRLAAAGADAVAAIPADATARFGDGSPAVAPGAITSAPAASAAGALPALDLGEVLDEQVTAALERSTPPTAAPAVPEPPRRRSASGGMFEHFASRESGEAHAELLGRLETESDPGAVGELLDSLGVRAERVLQDEPAVAAGILRRIVVREREVQDLESKRAFFHTVKRLAKPGLLAAVVRQLVLDPDTREQGVAVLARAGEDGADAVIEQLAAAEGRAERRVYFDALVELQAGVPTLVHMLGDARWYVARNAAALLGEMRAREAEQPLLALLDHDDERVRHAATIAMMRLGTARALPTIQRALKDSAPQMRIQATVALTGRRESNIGTLLLRALDDERDDEVVASLLAALGRLRTAEAVARLVEVAAPDKTLFRRKSVAHRIAAVQALAEAGTPQAVAALTGLRDDRADQVRAAVGEALRRRTGDATKDR